LQGQLYSSLEVNQRCWF